MLACLLAIVEVEEEEEEVVPTVLDGLYRVVAASGVGCSRGLSRRMPVSNIRVTT